jgi:antitoxin (DNA-binding transcriptional repressor) of toxin-antitoxin stability system
MLKYFRMVENTGEVLVVTDHRKPVLKIVPIKKRTSIKSAFARYQGKVKYSVPVTEPESEEWG